MFINVRDLLTYGQNVGLSALPENEKFYPCSVLHLLIFSWEEPEKDRFLSTVRFMYCCFLLWCSASSLRSSCHVWLTCARRCGRCWTATTRPSTGTSSTTEMATLNPLKVVAVFKDSVVFTFCSFVLMFLILVPRYTLNLAFISSKHETLLASVTTNHFTIKRGEMAKFLKF